MSDDNVTSFGGRRFYQSDKTHETRLEDVLDAAREFIRESRADHVIVLVGRRLEEDFGSSTRFFSGGQYTYHEQVGLIHQAALQFMTPD